MKYPKLSCEMNKRTKLCGNDIKTIQKLRDKGWTYPKIAKKFHIHWTTAWKRLHPKSYKINLETSRVNNYLRYHSDKKFRERAIKYSITRNQRRYDEDPEYRKFRADHHRRWRQNNER